MSNDQHNARLGNKVRDSGVDRCACGCKYWENDTCVDCGATEPEDVPCVACGRTDLPLHVSGRCPECEPLCTEADDECFGPVIDGLCNRHRFDQPATLPTDGPSAAEMAGDYGINGRDCNV